MASFTCFPDLPLELRQKIWETHFTNHRRVHIILTETIYRFRNTEPILPPIYAYFDPATSNSSPYTYATPSPRTALIQSSTANSEAHAGFISTHLKACLTACPTPDTSSFPSNYFNTDPTTTRILAEKTLAASSRRALAARHLICPSRDLVYVVDDTGMDLFTRVCHEPWMPKVHRLAVLVANNRTGLGRSWDVERDLRQAIVSVQGIQEGKKTRGEAFMDGERPGARRLEELLLVVIPRLKGREVDETRRERAKTLPRDEFGFVALEDCRDVMYDSEFSHSTWVVDRVAEQIAKAFPVVGNRPFEVRAVVDLECSHLLVDDLYTVT